LKTKKKIYLFLILFSLSLTQAGFSSALETKYPPVPGLPYVITDDSGLAQYVGYFFSLAIIASGILAVIVLTIGGIRLIMSGGNPAGRKEAVDMIKGSVLGMVLVVSSFMLLRTINPALIEPSLTPLPSVEGIYYTNGADKKPAPMAEANASNRPDGYNQILYDCSSGADLFIWKFPERNFEGIDSAFVEAITCGNSTDISGAGSFKMAFKAPGIYYFLESGCTGYMSGANTAGGQLSEPFKDKVKSIKIINNLQSDIRYGIIFHNTNDPSEVGACTLPYFITDLNQEEACSTAAVPEEPPYDGTKTLSSSATFFMWNGKNPETSGAGVDFYSEPWGKFLGARAGKHALSQNTINGYWSAFAQNIKFKSYSGNRPPAYKTMYANFSQRSGSMFLNDNYLAAIYSKTQFCQIFFNDVFNFKTTEFSATGNNVNAVYIIPVK